MTDTSIWPCVLDGEIQADGTFRIDAQTDAFTHGEGLFESFPVVGGRPRFLDRHVRRLAESAAILGLLPAPELSMVQRDIDLVGRETRQDDFSVRLVLFRDHQRVRRLVAPSALPPGVNQPIVLGRVAPWLDGARPLARLKTLNYLGARLAHADGLRRGFDEVVFVLPDGTVLEGTRSSVFMVENGVLHTPPLTLPILPGVTREVVIEEARRLGHRVVEEPFSFERLRAADVAFVTASVRGVRPVVRLLDRAYPEVGGALTTALAAAYGRRFADG